MTTAILGRGKSSLSALPGATVFSLRHDHSLSAFDLLVVDMDAVFEEFGLPPAAAETAVLEAKDSRELLSCARRWREHIRLFLGTERLCAIIWSRPPICRIHTLQDIVEFSAADLLPDIAVRFERLGASSPVQSVAGEPLSQFVEALGLPFSTDSSIHLSPSQPIMTNASGSVCACYTYIAPAHLVFAGIASGQPARERLISALHALASHLGSASYSYALPAWADAIRLPGEQDAISQLQGLDARMQSLWRERESLAARVAFIRRLKSLLAGSPAQACLVFSDSCRRRGLNLMRDFPDDAGVVMDLRRLGQPVLFVFDDGGEPSTVLSNRLEALLETVRFETDIEALSCIVRVGATAPARSYSTPTHRILKAQQVLDLLCDETRPLDPALSDLLRTYST